MATDCGANGIQVGTDTFNTATGAGSFDCSFPDGPPARPSASPSATPTAPPTPTRLAVTVNNVKPSVTLSGDATADEGSTHTYSFTVTDPGRHPHHHHRLRCQRAKVGGSDTYDAVTGLGSFECFFADGPAFDQRDRHRHRLRRRHRHRQPDRAGHHQQRGPDRHPLRRQRPLGQRGHHPHLQLHHQRPGRDTFALLSTDCGANGSQVGPAPSTPPPAPAASTAPSPTARPRAASASRSRTPTAPTATPPPRR